MDSGKPYKQYIENGYIIRCFDPNTPNNEYTWHQDQADRLVLVLSGTNWLFQMDNQIPIILQENVIYPIKKHTWHRIKPGSQHLILKIAEF